MPLDASIQDLLRVAKEEAASLAADAAPAAAREMTVSEYLATILKADGIPAGVKAALEKVTGVESWSGTTVVAFTAEMYTDPWQLKPVTLAEVSPASMSSGTAVTTFSSNAALQKRKELSDKVEKALVEVAQLVEGKTDPFATALRTEVTKAGPATSKLEQVKAVLAIKSDLDDYDLRYKVSQLVGMLAEHAAVERMYESGAIEKAEKPKAAAPAAPVTKADSCAFPSNLANAEYDASTGRFKHADLSWGRDSA